MADSAARTASRPTQREQAAADAAPAILAAAADCIVRDGLAQVRMASIARTAGVSAGLLHYHFDTKELLFGEVLTLLARSLRRAQPARHGRRRRGSRRTALVRSSTGACPATSSARTSGCSGRSWPCSASATRTSPRSGPTSTRTSTPPSPTSSARASPPGSSTPRSTRGRWPRRRSPSPTGSAPGCWPSDPNLGLEQARSRHRHHRRHPGRPRRPAPGAGALRGRGRGVTPRPRLARPSRRGFLTGGLALGASLTLPGCAYIRDDAPADAPLPPSAKAEIDGDLVYFNWADYLAPEGRQGLPGGVRRQGHRVQLRLDGGHVRQARRRQPVRHRLPDRQVGRQAPARGQAPLHRPRPAAERRPGLLLRVLLQRALVRRRVAGVDPLHRLQDRHRLAHRQGVVDDRQLGGPLERRGQRPRLHPRRPGRGAGHGRAAPRLRRQHREGLGAGGDEEAPDQPEGVPPRLLLRRHQQHGRRRRVGAPHVERRLPLPPAGAGRRPHQVRLRGAERGHADQLRRLRDPGQRQAPRHRDGVHRLPAPARERHQEHELPLLPVPGEGRAAGVRRAGQGRAGLQRRDLRPGERERLPPPRRPTRSSAARRCGPK